MRSGFAKLFLLAAVAYAFFTVGEVWTSVGLTIQTYMGSQEKIFVVSGAIARWAIDPIFLCGTAVMVEFLERIWRELAKTNAARNAGES